MIVQGAELNISR